MLVTALEARYHYHQVEPVIVIGQKWWNIGNSVGFHIVLRLTFTGCLLSARHE